MTTKKGKTQTQVSFKNFGISEKLLEGIKYIGYTEATPIQNKAIPPILNGRNVLAMAPTGSGKTAAFLIPMLQHLEKHSRSGPRALIISPTRELAIQTQKFTCDIGKYTDLKVAVILGGSNIEDDFRIIHECPDVIIATPGRLLHLKVEMGDNMDLSSIEYVVFDEGDRLFELDMAEQLNEILNSLSSSKQTVIFSATLPSQLTEFAKAGMSDPLLIRLDTDRKLSKNLTVGLLYCLEDDKLPALLELIQNIGPKQQVLVFFSTQHHILYVSEIMEKLSIKHVVMFSSLDKQVREINQKRFLSGHTKIMLVTDLAARGIDIPDLPYVINYNFPDKPKLFLHRVGRVARAGCHGTSYSLVDNTELPYLLDTGLFLNKPLHIVSSLDQTVKFASDNNLIGSIPSGLLLEQRRRYSDYLNRGDEISTLYKSMLNATKKYNKTKILPSHESYVRSNVFSEATIKMRRHPIFSYVQENDLLHKFQNALAENRNSATIFANQNNFHALKLGNYLSKTREHRKDMFDSFSKSKKGIEQFILAENENDNVNNDNEKCLKNVEKIDSKNNKNLKLKDTKVGKESKSKEENKQYYVPNLGRTIDKCEEGLKIVKKGFASEAKEVQLEMVSDRLEKMKKNQVSGAPKKVWDTKKRKFVGPSEDPKHKKFKTEHGNYISSSYKTDRYNKWKKRNNANVVASSTADNENNSEGLELLNKKRSFKRLNLKPNSNVRSRDHTIEQSLKKYKDKQKKKDFQKSRVVMKKNNFKGKGKSKK